MFHMPKLFYDIGFLRKLSFSLLRRYARYMMSRYVVETRMGAVLLLDQVNKVDLHLLCDGFWEADRIEYLVYLISKYSSGKKSIFLDIGAHGALYSIVLAKSHTFERIVAFEPDPRNLAQIYANIMMNELATKVEVVTKAVSSKTATANFVASHESNRGQSHVAKDGGGARKDTVEVETITIDDVLDARKSLVVAKIDVEGHEGDVILGMSETISNNSVILQIENNDNDLVHIERYFADLGVRRIHSIGQDHYFLKYDLGV